MESNHRAVKFNWALWILIATFLSTAAAHPVAAQNQNIQYYDEIPDNGGSSDLFGYAQMYVGPDCLYIFAEADEYLIYNGSIQSWWGAMVSADLTLNGQIIADGEQAYQGSGGSVFVSFDAAVSQGQNYSLTADWDTLDAITEQDWATWDTSVISFTSGYCM